MLLIHLVLSIIAQIHYVLTLNNRNILGILGKKSPTNALPIQDDFQQPADGIYLVKYIE